MRTRRLQIIAFVTLAALASFPARSSLADPPVDPPAKPIVDLPADVPDVLSVVNRVLVAIERKDDEALRALAELTEPDPWLVADNLLGHDYGPAAVAFSRASPVPIRGPLVAFTEGWKETAATRLERERLNDAAQFLRQKLQDSARIMLEKAKPPAHSVIGVVELTLRAEVEEGLGALSKAIDDRGAAGEASSKIGWKTQALESFWNEGRIARAALQFGRARDAWRRRADVADAIGEPLLIAQAALDVSVASKEMGDLVGAEIGLRRAAALFEKVGVPLDRSSALTDLAYTYQSLGRFARGLTSAEAAIDIALGEETAAKALGGERLTAAVGALMLARLARGAVRTDAGLHDDATRDFESVLAMAKASEDLEVAAYAFGNLGVSNDRAHRYEAAERYEREALGFFEKRSNGRRVAQAVANLAETLVHRGKGILGLDYLRAAIERIEHDGDVVAALCGRWSLGVLCREAGELDEAIQIHEAGVAQAIELGTDALLVRHLSGLAMARAEKKDWKGALDAAIRGRALVGGLVEGLADEEYVEAREAIAELFETGAVAAARLKNVGEFFTFVEFGRAGALLRALGGVEATRSAVLSPTLAVADAAARAAESSAFANYLEALKSDVRANHVSARTAWTAAKDARREVAARIQREAEGAANVVYPAPRPLADVQSAIRPDEALVLYTLSPRGLFALVVRRSGAPLLVELPVDVLPTGEASDVKPAPSPDARSTPRGDAESNELRLAALAEGLTAGERGQIDLRIVDASRKALVVPLALPDDVRTVMLSLDAAFAHVPPALLFPNRAVAVVPSGTVLAILRANPAAAGKGVVGLGDPIYDSKPTDIGIRRLRDELHLVALTETRTEVTRVADVTLFGENATERRLTAAIADGAPRLRALHLACHGIMLPNEPSASALALTVADDDDGLLTAREVLHMRVPADLVVLSACRSGAGEFARGEGLMGLARAFMAAGAPRVIASLWKVDDAATRALMTKFYELWNPKPDPKALKADVKSAMGAAAALRAAQDYVREQPKWKDSYYWAAWELWGAPD